MAPQDAAAFESLLSGVPFACVGEVTAEPVLAIVDGAKPVAGISVDALVENYKATLGGM
ncbi:hypothetical protein SDC9_205256 [bioreactor metagenome]|uniref:Uncharacterized protein n=1 Tax=bioreactor metagenome TaxID=1076179 RepID=A0A645J376_9ZZZZ